MKMIPAEALHRFKRTDPRECLDDAEKRFNQLPGVEQDKLCQFIAEYPDIDVLYRRTESLASMIRGVLETHQEYLASQRDKDFTIREIQEHNEFIDDLFLKFIFLGKKIETFPPRPVLPPPAPLIKISGVIDKVEFTRAMACFDAEAYSSVREELELKRQQDNIGALVAMTAQALTGTPPHAIINDGRPNKIKCLYVKGKVDGKVFSGWFGMTNIRPGDRVEMAVMPDGDVYLAYAIANPEQRTISMTPGCYHGSKIPPFFWYLIALICTTCPFLFLGFWKNTDIVFPVLLLYFSISLPLSWLIWRASQKRDKPMVSLFERICTTLGIPEPEKIDFDKHTRKIFKKNKELITPEREMPIKNMGDRYFFYY